MSPAPLRGLFAITLTVLLAACGGGGDSGGGSSSSSNSSSSSSSSSSNSSSSGGGDTGPVFGYPVYTRAEIDAWSTNSPEYTRLAQSWAGRDVNRPHTSYEAEVMSREERVALIQDAAYMKVQSVLWAADQNTARRDKVAAMLDELHSVTALQTDTSEQYRLESGWLCTNLAQAAAIIDYHHDQLDRFLTQVCYPALDWTNGPNWHASFADSRLAIAAYVGDSALWEDAKAYFYQCAGAGLVRCLQVVRQRHTGRGEHTLRPRGGHRPLRRRRQSHGRRSLRRRSLNGEAGGTASGRRLLSPRSTTGIIHTTPSTFRAPVSAGGARRKQNLY